MCTSLLHCSFVSCQEENYPFELSQLLRLSEESFQALQKYDRKQALTLEHVVLRALKFDLTPPTALFFMETLATHKLTSCRYDPVVMDCIE